MQGSSRGTMGSRGTETGSSGWVSAGTKGRTMEDAAEKWLCYGGWDLWDALGSVEKLRLRMQSQAIPSRSANKRPKLKLNGNLFEQ